MNDSAIPTDLAEAVTVVAGQLNAGQVHFGHGTDNAHDEAAWLCLYALGLPLDTDLASVASLQSQQWHSIQHWVNLRIGAKKPLAYLTHEAWLQGVPFYCDERAIVPRSLIAEVIADGSIDAWLSDQTRRVLDLCTGNGSLAVLAALAYPDVEVDAADLSQDALEVAGINVKRHGLNERITLLQGDGLSACAASVKAHGPYDLILCNPPYVNASSMAALPAEYRVEPVMALASGADGMDFCRSLLAQVSKFLGDQGVLILEIGHEKPNFQRAFPGLEPIWVPTSSGQDSVLLISADHLQIWTASLVEA